MQRRDRAVVKVGSCVRYVAQQRNAKDVGIGGVVGDSDAAIVNLGAASRLPILLDDSEFCEPAASDTDAIVAFGTADFDEFLESGARRGVENLHVAGQVRVERRGRHQSALPR